MATLSILFFLLVIVGVYFLVALRKITFKLAGTALLGLSMLIAACYLNLRSYSVFTHEELAAKVKVERPRGQLYDMVVTLSQIKSGRFQDEETYLLKGNQWMIDGDILKWKPAFNAMGFKTAYKITRISGRYLLTSQQLQGAQTVYTVNAGTGQLWLFLHKYQKLFPFVEAVYGNGAYVFAQDKTFGVYVTTSGFIIKEYKDDDKGR